MNYEFKLANDVVLQVKPGSKTQTFNWGLRNEKQT
ncbi:protein of unknown function [Nitrospira japonica]|uniref:Uncharacterized protein n=1 Tax=Nitrospira japonica TaxID=1325564 RepID=A0A1W1I359_9BACT|nr:protein of unknown function [Nitrospira japonica]